MLRRRSRNEIGRSSARSHALPLLLLLAAALLAFSDVIGAERGLYYRDHILAFKPLLWSVANPLAEGRWPLFALGQADGMPLEGLLGSALYTPPSLLLLAQPFETVYDLYVFVHLPILGAGVYFLGLRGGLDRVPALGAALVAALGGPVLSFENLLVGLVGLAYAPWIGWALLGVFHRPSLRGAAILAAPLAFQAQGIMPELLVLDLAICLGVFWLARPRVTWSLAGVLLVSGVMALLLASVDLLPLIEALAGSRRSAGFSAAERSGWAFSPWQAIELIAPGFWAPPEVPFLNVPVATGSSADPPYLTSLYLGAALSMALAASLRGRVEKVLWGLAVLVILIAAGSRTPLHGWLTSLPVLRSGRYAIKYLILFDGLVAVLVALALRRLAEGAKAVAVFAGLQSALLLGLYFASGTTEWAGMLARNARPFESSGAFEIFKSGDVISLFSQAMQGRLALALGSSAILTLLAFAAVRHPNHSPWLAMGMVVLLAMDLGLAGRMVIAGAPVEAARLPAEVAKLVGGRTQRVQLSNPPPTPHLPGQTYFEDFVEDQGRFGYNAYDSIRRYYDPDLAGQGNVVHQSIYRLMTEQPWPAAIRWLERAGVRHMISAHPQPLPVALEYQDLVGRPVFVYALPNATPYVHGFTRWRSVASTPEALRAALGDSDDVGVLIDAGSVEAQTSSCAAQTKLLDGESSTSRLAIESRARCRSLVVVQEVPLPRWQVTIDGALAKFETAEAGYLAVVVPEGSHRVVFEYRSATRELAWISLVGLLLWCAMLFVPAGWAPGCPPTGPSGSSARGGPIGFN